MKTYFKYNNFDIYLYVDMGKLSICLFLFQSVCTKRNYSWLIGSISYR